MKGEINRDYYCSAMLYKGACLPRNTLQMEYECESRCPNHHRKWPTPEQFKEEYREEYPNEGIGYWKYRNSTIWKCDFYGDFKSYIAPTIEEAAEQKHQIFVCACTPFGKPPNDWRPE